MTKVKDECCTKFKPESYQNKTHVWKDKLFLQDEVKQVMHMPINMGAVITRMFKKVEEAQAAPPTNEFLVLCYDPSPWKSEIYMTVNKNIPGGKMAKLTGKFVSKVYDGQYNEVPAWIKDMDTYLASHGQKAKKYYFHYAYCPKCAKKYGHNYCIAFAQVD